MKSGYATRRRWSCICRHSTNIIVAQCVHQSTAGTAKSVRSSSLWRVGWEAGESSRRESVNEEQTRSWG